MTISSDPSAVALFRERTDKATARGAMLNTFRCKRCLQTKSTTGRKRASKVIKDGWICGHCHEIREAKREAKRLLLQEEK